LQIGAASVDSANVPDDAMKAAWTVSDPSQLRNVFAGDKVNSPDDYWEFCMDCLELM